MRQMWVGAAVTLGLFVVTACGPTPPAQEPETNTPTTPTDAGTLPQAPEGEPPYDPFVAQAMAHILPLESVTPRIIYVAPPMGSLAGTGTKEDPLRDLISAVRNAEAGDRIYLAPGVYLMNEVRDQWGHTSSSLETGNDGAAGNPIILSTDPEEYDPAQGQIATIDFQYGNTGPAGRTTCFSMSHDFWIVEKLEMRHIQGRGIWLSGYDNIIRNTHLHHLNTPGNNNQALVMLIASGRETNNFLIRNHLHHVGEIDTATNELLNLGSVNGGCVYTETRQSYDSTFVSLTAATTVEELRQGVLPPDSHAYLYNNDVHHCYYGLATKNDGEGPYYFIANVIHDVNAGIKTAFSHSVIRDNIIYAGPMGSSGTGIQVGQTSGGDNYLASTQNGTGIEVAHNTIVGFNYGIWYYAGWDVRSHHNLIVEEGEGLHPHRHQYFWFQDGMYPGIRGEYLLADLDMAHPYVSTHFATLPPVMYEFGFQKLSSTHNAYSKEPVVASADAANNAEISGQIFDTDYVVIPAAEVNSLFRDRAAGDYRRNPAVYPEYGSRL